MRGSTSSRSKGSGVDSFSQILNLYFREPHLSGLSGFPRVGVRVHRWHCDVRATTFLLVRGNFEAPISIGPQLKVRLAVLNEAHHQLRNSKRECFVFIDLRSEERRVGKE